MHYDYCLRIYSIGILPKYEQFPILQEFATSFSMINKLGHVFKGTYKKTWPIEFAIGLKICQSR